MVEEEIKKETSEEEKKEDKKEEKKSFKDKLEKKDLEIAELKKEVAKYKNEYYKAYADTQNLRKSLEKDHQEAMRYRSEGFLDKLLPVMDGFYMALANEPKDPALKNYLVGFQYIYNNLESAIESEGASQIVPKIGDKFDPNSMNAIEVEEDEGEENRVLRVCLVGMKLHDRIIRPASVIVSKKKTEEKKEESEGASSTQA